jgi:hypothetical protein
MHSRNVRRRPRHLTGGEIDDYVSGILLFRREIRQTVREFRQFYRRRDAGGRRGLSGSALLKVGNFLSSADEVTLLRDLVVPLFSRMGYKCVRADEHIDRSQEFGQDIRELKLRLPTGHLLYFVVQVKKQRLYGGVRAPSASAEKVLLQLSAALHKRVFDYDANLQVLPDHVYLILVGGAAKGAVQLIEEKISELTRRDVLVIYREALLELCRTYGLPRDALSRIGGNGSTASSLHRKREC